MKNMLAALMQSNEPQGAAVNTVKLRKMWNDYAIGEAESGREPLRFESWAEQYYPRHQILHPN